MAKIASLLNDHVFFNLPSGQHYDKEDWRKDLRRLIKLAGSKDKDVIILVPIAQMLKEEFLRADVDSLLARGEIPDLFSQEEKHQLNEVLTYCYHVIPFDEIFWRQTDLVKWCHIRAPPYPVDLTQHILIDRWFTDISCKKKEGKFRK